MLARLVLALVEALAVAGPAQGVGWAGEQLADGCASQDVEGVWPADLVRTALLVRGAGRHRGNLTLSCDGVPHM